MSQMVTANGGGFLPSRGVMNGITLVVAFVWAASYIADIALATYEPDSKVHLALMIIIGGPPALNLIRGGSPSS